MVIFYSDKEYNYFGGFVMNIIWAYMLLISLVFYIATGQVAQVVDVLFTSTENTVTLFLELTGMICMWSGFIKIAEKSGMIEKVSMFINPLIRIIFPELKNDKEISGHIAMNMTANMIGLGNVATPMGLKAMAKLQEKNENKNKLSKTMLTFVILNTASIQLIPTSVIAIRTAANSQEPTNIVLPTIIASIASVIIGILIVKILYRGKT